MPLLFDRVSETADAGVPPAAPRFGVGRGNVRREMRSECVFDFLHGRVCPRHRRFVYEYSSYDHPLNNLFPPSFQPRNLTSSHKSGLASVAAASRGNDEDDRDSKGSNKMTPNEEGPATRTTRTTTVTTTEKVRVAIKWGQSIFCVKI